MKIYPRLIRNGEIVVKLEGEERTILELPKDANAELKKQSRNICPDCGTKTLPNFKICPYCGEVLQLSLKQVIVKKLK